MAYFRYGDKNIYYEETGSGFPLILLHGNSVSSKMFTGITDLYNKNFKVILIYFLGHGNSDRLAQFPCDFWYDQAMQVIELITHNHYGRVNLIGTSGGALAALNVALERSEKIFFKNSRILIVTSLNFKMGSLIYKIRGYTFFVCSP